jgi:CarD family transcriptional regulator
MPFKAGDYIVHPAFGIGQIVKVEERRFSDNEMSLYYQVTLPDRQVWIPVVPKVADGLRSIIAGRDLERYRLVLKGRPAPLPTNYFQRQRELFRRLQQDAFQGLCEVVRDLTALGRHSRLGASDKTTLDQTRENLSLEWSLVAGVSEIAALKEIDDLLQAGQ